MMVVCGVAEAQFAKKSFERAGIAAGESPVGKHYALYDGELGHPCGSVVARIESDGQDLELVAANDSQRFIDRRNEVLRGRRAS